MRTVLFIGLVLAGVPAYGAVAGGGVDTLAVELRPVPEAIESFRADTRFRYQRGGAREPGWWSRLMDWFADTVLAPTAEYVPAWVYRWIATALALAALAFALYHILTGRRQGLVARREPHVLDEALREQGIAGVDLDKWLAEAEVEGRHRDAVRVRYLIALQRLAAEGALEWRIDKTNRAYLRELGSHPSAASFAAFTELFERVWYGDRPSGEGDAGRSRILLQEIAAVQETEVVS